MKRGTVNQRARKHIADYCRTNNITRCEIKLKVCMGEAGGAAHRHKRRWYYDKPIEALWDINQWLPACAHCHEIIEFDADLTKQVFLKLRGVDKYEPIISQND